MANLDYNRFVIKKFTNFNLEYNIFKMRNI